MGTAAMNVSIRLLCAVLALLMNVTCGIPTISSTPDEIRSHIQQQVTGAWEELEGRLSGSSSRRLLQNPDIPALTPYGGKTMEGEAACKSRTKTAARRCCTLVQARCTGSMTMAIMIDTVCVVHLFYKP